MSSKIFLQALQSKLKGGSSRSIHLNALPGRFATRLDLKQFDLIEHNLAQKFLKTLLAKQAFEFKVTFDSLDLNTLNQDEQKRLGLIAKRMNSIIIENDDYHKEHGVKTLGFGYPILIKRSVKDPTKIIKAPLFVWPLEAIKSRNKVNEWSFLRNKVVQPSGETIDSDIHSVSINEVLISFIKGEDDIVLPSLSEEALEDAVIDEKELIDACGAVLNALNSGSISDYEAILTEKFKTPVDWLPDAAGIDAIANNKAYIHFGGVFGLFRAQKESIITDIARLLERHEEFQFENLTVENLSDSPFSAVNTDPAQQAIIEALGNHTNQIIQGPPGTGKSQSLTALVTNALANGLKCLVVCEKKTALDVIRRNIEKANPQMASLVAVIDDVNDDREAIVDSVRDRQNSLPAYQYVDRVKSKYSLASEQLNELMGIINAQHVALAKPILRGQTWDMIVGRYLSLRKNFNHIPLKGILDAQDFEFIKNENELNALISMLSKASNLYLQSLESQDIFSILDDRLFAGSTVGEARARLEAFTAKVSSNAPKINAHINKLSDQYDNWVQDFVNVLPKAIKSEFEPRLPFLAGEQLNAKISTEFGIEKAIHALIDELAILRTQSKKIKQQYRDDLTSHYNTYSENLGTALSEYFQFVNGLVSIHGQSVFSNGPGEKLKTKFLGLFLKKYRDIAIGRGDIIARIKHIRTTHLTENYLVHSYNDEIVGVDLSVFVGNLHELKDKLEDWKATVPETIEKYVSKMKELHFHERFQTFEDLTKTALNKHTDLVQDMINRDHILEAEHLDELNMLIDRIPNIIDKLGNILGLYREFRQYLDSRAQAYNELYLYFEDISNAEINVCHELNLSYDSFAGAIERCEKLLTTSTAFITFQPSFRLYYDWRSFYQGLSPALKKTVDLVALNVEKNWEKAFECWYLFWVLSYHEPENLPKNDYELQQFVKLKEDFNAAQLENIVAQWKDKQLGSVRFFKSRGNAVNSLFNKKGSKGMRRNSLRTIIKIEFELFTDFFPVVLLNPSVCSSIIPLEEGIFDIVIFDEASQLRLEDTYASLVRGKAKIVSGDKHQMAPSSYFEGSGALLEPLEGEDESEDDIESEHSLQRSQINLADSESLLAFAVDKGFKESYLTVHYRSRHPFLIDFSNYAFYGKRLIPVPASKEYTPIEFIQVDGIYDNQVNKEEALAIVKILGEQISERSDGTLPSVGIATFNIYQRNLILEEIAEARRMSARFDFLISRLGDSFFVKNLENIQGDERDIIIISTTFGRKVNGTFSQSFGPIIQGKGHRMLNVIITRAKDKVIICNSFPKEYVGQYSQLIQAKGNKGRAVLYAYLAYAKAVSDQNHELRENILNLLGEFCVDKQYDHAEPGIGSESVFEDEVFDRLAQHIGTDRIEQQYKIGGFRIDMVIKPKVPGKPMIAIECDGAKYHSSPEAYAWDLFRQEQLEKFGFVFHRIWSTNWWDSAERELDNLLGFIRKNDGDHYHMPPAVRSFEP